MKYFIPVMLCVFLFFSCKKNTQENTTPPKVSSSAVLDSSFFYSTGPKEIVLVSSKFQYDPQGRFTGIYAVMTDSTEDHHPGAPPDTSTMVLTYSGADTLPSTYYYQEQLNYYPQGAPGTAMLAYDNQGRIILDSPVNPIYTLHFTYGDGYATRTDQDLVATIDTLFTDGNNISIYKVGPNYFLHSFTYSNNPNPYYMPQLAAHLGPVLYNEILDISSKNLFSKQVYSDIYGETARIYNYTWTLNSDGQVIAGVGTDQNTGQPVEYYRFVYKNQN
ncbi:MAG: hypothetical protein Q8918_19185 [Bacteroidota bacterium]|nr:hypothetical protein [Bacteroidota bacterium]